MWIALLSSLALLFALSSQLLLGIQPCILCVYQRFVFAALVASDAMRWKRITQCIAFSGLMLTAYHIGVEQHWWRHPGCIDEGPAITIANQSPQELMASIKAQTMRPMVAGCDTITWRIFGVSATIWTALLYVVINGVAWYGYRKNAAR